MKLHLQTDAFRQALKQWSHCHGLAMHRLHFKTHPAMQLPPCLVPSILMHTHMFGCMHTMQVLAVVSVVWWCWVGHYLWVGEITAMYNPTRS